MCGFEAVFVDAEDLKGYWFGGVEKVEVFVCVELDVWVCWFR